MNRLIHDALKYVSSSFLLDTSIEENLNDQLPFQLKNRSELWQVRIETKPFLVLAAADANVLAANNFLQVRRIESQLNLPLILVTNKVSSELKILVKQLRIGLIIPGRYTMLPSLFIHREKDERTDDTTRVDTKKTFGIIPSYLVCYYLSGYFGDGFNSTDIIRILGVSKMAVSRAVRELLANQLIDVKGTARATRYFFSESRKSLWNHQRHRIAMLSTGFVGVNREKLSPFQCFITGESALSKYSLLSSPETPNMGVCMTNDARYMRPITPATIDGDYFFKIMKIIPENPFEEPQGVHDTMLQIFPYTPLIENGVIDPVFLIFSRLNRSDVRVKSTFHKLEMDIYNNLKDQEG